MYRSVIYFLRIMWPLFLQNRQDKSHARTLKCMDEFTALDGSSRIFPYGNETVTVVQAAYSCYEFLCLLNHRQLPASNVERACTLSCLSSHSVLERLKALSGLCAGQRTSL